MTLQSDAAAAAAAARYRVAGIQSAEAYRANALAVQVRQQAAEAAAAEAAYRANLPVITAAVPAVTDPGPVAIARPQQPARADPAPSPSQAVVPLPAASVDGLLAIEGRHDPQGVAALRAEWGSEMGTNLGYAYRYLAGHLTDEQWERAKEIPLVTVPILRLLAEMGRAEAHATMTLSTQPRGANQMAEQMTRDAAMKKFNELTKLGHDLLARGDRIGARETFEERGRISAALFPGDTAPDADHRQVVS